MPSGFFSFFYRILKRGLDILFSLVGLAVTLFISAAVFLAARLDGDRDCIIYSQIRIGRGGRPFKLYKFRTMITDSEEALQRLLQDPVRRAQWESDQKLKDDPRITHYGHLLRALSLDELPQFWNVLKGDMSLIGPRPLVPGELEAHGGDSRYNLVRPGLTGWWACNGRSDICYEERLALEYYYVEHLSFGLDLKCFFRTVYILLLRPNGR